MKIRWLVGLLALVAAMGFCANSVIAQDKSKAPESKKEEPKKAEEAKKGADAKPAAGQRDQAAEMAAWAAAATPGEHHGHLKALAGNWSATMKMWEDPAGAPTESKSTVMRKLIMGDRFLQEEYKGDFMGMPFEGLGFVGYDNLKKKYTSTWMDNMGTCIVMMQGACKPGGKSFEFNGEMDDPMTGKPMKVRSTIKIESDDKHMMEMFGTGPDGKEMRMFEMTCTRTK